MKLSDEQLMAYADGDPSSADAATAERARTGFSVEERKALEDYRRTRDLVREAFAEDDREPLPAGLAAMILGRQDLSEKEATACGAAESRPAGAPDTNVIALRRATRPRPLMRVAVALAASIALAFIILPLWQVGHRPADATNLVAGPVPAGSALATVLEWQPSAVPVTVDAPAARPRQHLMIAATFRDRSARVCREVELLDADLAPRMAAVACRASATGNWHVEGTAVIAQQGKPSTFAPAGAPEEEALAALRSMLGAKATMSPADERALLDNGWK